MAEMTHRQRILAAVGKQPVDKLPFGARIDLWYNYHSAKGTLPDKYQGWNIVDILRHLGAGCSVILGSRITGAGAPGRIFTLWETAYPGIEVTVHKEGPITTTEYKTPKGTLRSRMEFNHTEGYIQGYTAERLFKSEADYPAIEFMIENTSLTPDYAAQLDVSVVVG